MTGVETQPFSSPTLSLSSRALSRIASCFVITLFDAAMITLLTQTANGNSRYTHEVTSGNALKHNNERKLQVCYFSVA